jgi:hypothetical protein
MVLIMNPEMVSSISTKTGVRKMIRMFGEQQQVSRKVMENLDQAGISQQIGVLRPLMSPVSCCCFVLCRRMPSKLVICTRIANIGR